MGFEGSSCAEVEQVECSLRFMATKTHMGFAARHMQREVHFAVLREVVGWMLKSRV